MAAFPLTANKQSLPSRSFFTITYVCGPGSTQNILTFSGPLGRICTGLGIHLLLWGGGLLRYNILLNGRNTSNVYVSLCQLCINNSWGSWKMVAYYRHGPSLCTLPTLDYSLCYECVSDIVL